MAPVQEERLADGAAAAAETCEADPEFPILEPADHLAAVSADGLPVVSSKDRGDAREIADERPLGIEVFGVPHIGAIAEVLHPRTGKSHRSIELEHRDRLLEIRGRKAIVRVEATDVL